MSPVVQLKTKSQPGQPSFDAQRSGDESLTRQIIFTSFPDRFARKRRAQEFSLVHLAACIEKRKANTKESLPFIKGAIFGNEATEKQCLRHNDNVLAVTAIEADYDVGEITPRDARDRLSTAGICALIYTTPSHRKPGKGNRWRVICPLSKARGPDERKVFVARLNGLFDGMLAPESFVLSQSFYYGGTPDGTPIETFLVRGRRYIDEADDLDAKAIGPDRPKTDQTPPSSGSSEQKKAFNGDLELLRGAVMAIPNSDHDSYNDWLGMGMCIHFESDGSAEGLSIWEDWSQQSDEYDQHVQVAKWASFSRAYGRRRLTGASLIKLAQQHGWKRPAKQGGHRLNQADDLVDIASEAELFHSADQTAYADINIDEHRQTLAVRRKAFRLWLTRQYYERHGGSPNSEAMKTALGTIEAKACFDGPEREVYLRVASYDGKIYLDLGGTEWRVIEIDTNGWRIVDDAPVRFRRAAGMLPLPEPRRGGSIADLRPLLNVQAEEDFVLAIAWVLAALRDKGPYPVLNVTGEHGSAKSSFVRVLRQLVDPRSTQLRALPREDRDFYIAAYSSHIVAFDNLSRLPDWASDAICCLSTGGGYESRTLYTDLDQTIIDAERPVAFTGITDVVTRPDLADRCITLTLAPISETKRMTEQKLENRFAKVHALLLGALLDAVSTGLGNLPKISFTRLPRMADFAAWIVACEPALLWTSGTFMKAYEGNRANMVADILESDPVAVALRAWVSRRRAKNWQGSAGDLLVEIGELADDAVREGKDWPHTPRGMSGRLRRIAPFMRQIGIDIRPPDPGDGTRTYRILSERESK